MSEQFAVIIMGSDSDLPLVKNTILLMWCPSMCAMPRSVVQLSLSVPLV